jgi:uncharacterized repeat protein (TIGR01451 family)
LSFPPAAGTQTEPIFRRLSDQEIRTNKSFTWLNQLSKIPFVDVNVYIPFSDFNSGSPNPWYHGPQVIDDGTASGGVISDGTNWEGLSQGWAFSPLGGATRPTAGITGTTVTVASLPSVVNGDFESGLMHRSFPLIYASNRFPLSYEIPGWAFHGGSGFAFSAMLPIIGQVQLDVSEAFVLETDPKTIFKSAFKQVFDKVIAPKIDEFVNKDLQGGIDSFDPSDRFWAKPLLEQIKKLVGLGSPGKTASKLASDILDKLLPSKEDHSFMIGGPSALGPMVSAVVGDTSGTVSDLVNAVLGAVGNFDTITHNRLYVPTDTQCLTFDVIEPFVPDGDSKIEVDMTSADPGAKPDPIGTVTLPSGFFSKATYAVDVPAKYQGQVVTFSLKYIPGSAVGFDAAVSQLIFIDNVQFSNKGCHADLAVTKTVDDPRPVMDEVVTFTITVTDKGPGDATGVKVADLLPSGLKYQSAKATAGIYDAGAGVWTVGNLANGKTATLTLKAKVKDCDPHTNTATVSGDLPDPDPTNNSASATVTPKEADLAITKSIDNPKPNVGDVVTYTVTVTNNGPDDATGVTVGDWLPADHVLQSATPSQGTYDAAKGVWTVGGIKNGASVTLTLKAKVTMAYPGDLFARPTNYAFIKHSDECDPDKKNNFTEVSDSPQQADLEVTKSVDNPTPNMGDTLTYTVTVTNHGPTQATGVDVSDLLPDGLLLVKATPSQGIYDPVTGIWQLGTVDTILPATLTLQAKLTDCDPHTNTAYIVHSDQSDPNLDNNSASADETPKSADLQVTKTVDNPTPSLGDTVTFTAYVYNAGPNDATGVVVNDLVPAGLALAGTGVTVSTGSYDPATGDWTIGSMPDGDVEILTMRVIADGVQHTNTAQIKNADQCDPDDSNNIDKATINPGTADLKIDKGVDNPSPNEGDVITYTLTVTNNGPDNATGVVVQDRLPSAVTYVGDDSGGKYNPATGVWTAGNVPNGGSTTIHIQARVNQDNNTPGSPATPAVPKIVIQPQFKPVTETTGPDAYTHSLQSEPVVLIYAGPYWQTAQGQSDQHKLTEAAKALIDSQYLTSLTQYGSDGKASLAGTWNDSNPLTPPDTNLIPYVQNEVTNHPGQIPPTDPGNPQQQPLYMVVDDPSVTSSKFAGLNSTDGTIHTGVVLTQAGGGPGLDVDVFAMIFSHELVEATVAYVNVTDPGNFGGDKQVSDNEPNLAPYTAHVNGAVAQAYWSVQDNAWVIPGADKAPLLLSPIWNGKTFTGYTVLTPPQVNCGTPFTNTAKIGPTDQVDPDLSNNTAQVTVTPKTADLQLAKAVDNPTPNKGDTVTFTITLTDKGPNDATGVTVQDLLPAGLQFESYVASAGTYSDATGYWSVGSVGNGKSQTLTIKALVTDCDDHTNIAAITHANECDPNPSNNLASAEVKPQDADLELTKSVDNPTPVVGGIVNFTVTLNDLGPDTATHIQVNDLFPSGGLFFVNSTPSVGSFDTGTGVWTIDSLAVGTPATLVIQAQVVASGVWTNTATVSQADQCDDNPDNNTASATVYVGTGGAPALRVFYVNDDMVNAKGDWTTMPGQDKKGWGFGDNAMPKRTLLSLLAEYQTEMGPGDLVKVDTGVYDIGSNLVLPKYLTGVTFEGYNEPGWPTRHAVLRRTDSSPGTAIFELDGATNITFKNFIFEGGADAIVGTDAGVLTVQDSTFLGQTDAGVRLSGKSDGAEFFNNTFTKTGAFGVAIDNSGATLIGNAVSGATDTGIFVGNAVAQARLYNNTVTGSGKIGIHIVSPHPVLVNNTATGNPINVQIDNPLHGDGAGGSVAGTVTAAQVPLAAALAEWQSVLGAPLPLQVSVVVQPLTGGEIAESLITALGADGLPASGEIVIDPTAGGAGWFVDPDPRDSTAFPVAAGATAFAAPTGSAAAGRYDLYSAVLHELGHLLGFSLDVPAYVAHLSTAGGAYRFVAPQFTAALAPNDGDHLDSRTYPNDLMNATLAPSVRRLPSGVDAQVITTVRATALANPAGAPVPLAPHPEALDGTGLDDLINEDFAVGDPTSPHFGWQTAGSPVLGNGATLNENAKTLTGLWQTFTVLSGVTTLQFTITSMNLVANGSGPPDAFEVALLNANTLNPLVGPATGLTRTDAFLNFQQSGAVFFSPEVTIPGATASGQSPTLTFPLTVTVDLTGVIPGTQATLYFDLLGFGPATSSVVIKNVKLLGEGNQPPHAADDAYSVNENGTLNVPAAQGVLANDSDAENDPFRAVLVSNPAHGTLSFNADGTFTYTPDANFFGTDSFTYKDNDGADGNTATVTLTVNFVNQAPSFTKGPDVTVNEDSGAQTVPGWATAISAGPPNESGQHLTFQVSTDNDPLFSALPAIDPATGTLTYTPAPNASGVAHVSVRLHDDGGTANGGVDTSAAQTFTLTVNFVNDQPSFTAGNPPAVNEDTTAAQAVTGWATFSPDGSATPAANEAGQQVLAYHVTVLTGAGLFAVAPNVDAGGNLTYTLNPNVSGNATFSVSVQDNGGTANGGVDTSAAQTFTLTVNFVNDQPSFTAGNPTAVNEDSGANTVPGWVTSFNPGGAPDTNEAGQKVKAYTVSNVSNPALFATLPAVDTGGNLTYTLKPNVSGMSSFDLKVQDDGGTAHGGVDTSAAQTFTLMVNFVNDQPSFTASNPPAVNENTTAAQAVTGWATFSPDGSATPAANEAGQQVLAYHVTVLTGASLFAAAPTVDTGGNLHYTLNPNVSGNATFSVSVQDNGGTANGGVDTSAAQTFTLTVNPGTPATSAFVLILQDPTNPSHALVIADNAPVGTPVVGPGGAALLTTAPDEATIPGEILTTAPVGAFFFNQTLALAPPLEPAGTLFVHPLLISSGPGTLNIFVSYAGFQASGPGPTQLNAVLGGVSFGRVTFQEYVDTANVLFGMGSTAATPGVQGPFTGAFSDSRPLSLQLSGPYAITKALTVTASGPGSTGFGGYGLVRPGGAADLPSQPPALVLAGPPQAGARTAAPLPPPGLSVVPTLAGAFGPRPAAAPEALLLLARAEGFPPAPLATPALTAAATLPTVSLSPVYVAGSTAAWLATTGGELLLGGEGVELLIGAPGRDALLGGFRVPEAQPRDGYESHALATAWEGDSVTTCGLAADGWPGAGGLAVTDGAQPGRDELRWALEGWLQGESVGRADLIVFGP